MDNSVINKIIEMYNLRRPIKRISKETGVSESKIKTYLKNNNLWTGHRWMPFFFDEFFFDTIDTEEKAYWLGFIYADGYLSKKNNEIGIELKSDDKKHLEKFKLALRSEKNVKIYIKNSTYGIQENARICFGSKHMFNILLNYYGSVNKTFEGHIPKLYNKELIRHLIRGFFDGDGSITGAPKNSELLFRPSISFIGRKETLEYVEMISGFHWNWSKRFPERNTDNWQINVGRVHDCLNFLHYIYDDSTIYLDRKFNKYIECIENRKRNQAKARV